MGILTKRKTLPPKSSSISKGYCVHKSNAFSQAFLAIGTNRVRVNPQITRSVTLRFIKLECQVFPKSKPGNEYPRLCHQLLSRIRHKTGRNQA
jgi:hypothetical protein